MEENYFTTLCWFLPYINMNQPEVYIWPLPFILPPPSPKPGCHGAPSLSSLHHTANFHLLSILHTVVCMFPCCSLDPSHPLLPALCPPVCSLCLRLHMLSPFSHVRLTATLWTMACQAPLSMRFSRQEYWSGLPFPSPGDLPDSGIEPGYPTLKQILYHLSHQGSLHKS